MSQTRVERQTDIDELVGNIALILTGERPTNATFRKRTRTFSGGPHAFMMGMMSGWNRLPVFAHFLQTVELRHKRLECLLHTPFVTGMLQCFVHAQLRPLAERPAISPVAPLAPELKGATLALAGGGSPCTLSWFVLGAIAALLRLNAFGTGMLLSMGGFDQKSGVWNEAKQVVTKPEMQSANMEWLAQRFHPFVHTDNNLVCFLMGFCCFYRVSDTEEALAQFLSYEVDADHVALAEHRQTSRCACVVRGIPKVAVKVVKVLASPGRLSSHA